uniref:CHK domain-containing protein n=1 Tax=Bursaphelenchus xylophilus TaxID=6326 RepID=A0A1I7RM25_BURXY
MEITAEELDLPLVNTGYSLGWVLDKLEEHCEDYGRKRDNAKAKTISMSEISGGKGFMSRVFATTVLFDNGNSFKVALKCFTFDVVEAQLDEDYKRNDWKSNIANYHNNECETLAFYSSFPGFPCPKAYFTQRISADSDCGLEGKEAPGVIIMDLLDGISFDEVEHTLTRGKVLNFVKDFAYLHDSIERLPREEWTGRFKGRSHWDPMMFSSGIAKIKQMSEKYPEISSYCQEYPKLECGPFTDYVIQKRPKELDLWTVVHGDCRTNNIIFKKNADGTASDEILAYIDFQTACEGNPMFDAARVLTLCCDSQIRREISEEALQTYYNERQRLCKDRGEELKFDYQSIVELFELAFVQQAIQSAMFFSFSDANDSLSAESRKRIDDRLKSILIDADEVIKRRRIVEKSKE